MIPGFPQLGGMELLILLAIVLLFFGAKRIPSLARSLAKGTREFREGIAAGGEDEVRDSAEAEEEASPDETTRAEKAEVTSTAQRS